MNIYTPKQEINKHRHITNTYYTITIHIPIADFKRWFL